MVGWLGLPEIMVILVIALIIFGPKKLPELGKTVGKTIADFKKATNGIVSDIKDEIKMDEINDTLNSINSIKNNDITKVLKK